MVRNRAPPLEHGQKKLMPKFFNKDLGELAHQLTLSPRRLRVEQIRRIDGLLGDIQPEKAYPFDLVCYRITEYRKRGSEPGPSIPGEALICDLVTMAEMCSRQAKLTVAELEEPFLTHQELASEFNVSTKTIRRWRDRGLMGIRVTFDDGVNRLAFCRRTTERFKVQHKDLVERGSSFRQLTVAERRSIVERARELVSARPLKLHAAACIIAEETSRAIETVRYTLRRHDETSDTALFTRQGDPVRCERHNAIWRCHASGESIESIARAFDCSQEDVAETLRVVQVQEWRENPIDYIDNELFAAPNADALILDVPEPAPQPLRPQRLPADLPAYLRALYDTPLLTREQEQDLFRRYNYLKYKVRRALDALEDEDITEDAVAAVQSLLDRADAVKQRITKANLRLVVSIAKKHVGWSGNFFEIISDGNMSLMRAVEKFDFARGTKFSTYATWAITKNYARSIPEEHYRCARYVTGQDALLDQAAPEPEDEGLCASDRKRVREMIDAGMRELPEREQEIIRHHFGLAGHGGTMTLEQLGERFGVTKERVRQLERRALLRLREVLGPSLSDAVCH